jgi:hypothetical protein
MPLTAAEFEALSHQFNELAEKFRQLRDSRGQ